jgi:pimeloyl-ACP methyl ester carboxylesterase
MPESSPRRRPRPVQPRPRRRPTLWAAMAACSLAALGWSGDGPHNTASAQLLPRLATLPETPISQWTVMGTGPTHVVLIPGLACDGSIFHDFMEARARTYTFHALTLPGMAGTQPPPGVNTVNFEGTPWLDNAVLAIAHYIDSNGLDKPLVMGHAMGGTLAIRVGIEHPDLVSGVVTLDGFPAVPLHRPVAPEARRETIMTTVGANLLQQSETDWFRSTDMMATMFTVNDVRGQELGAIFRTTPHPVARRYMLEFYLTDPGIERLQSMDVPVLAVASIDLQTASLADQRGGVAARRTRWQDAMRPFKRGMLVFAEDCKHFLFDDCPEEIDAALAAFMKAHELGPARGEGLTPESPRTPAEQQVPRVPTPAPSPAPARDSDETAGEPAQP